MTEDTSLREKALRATKGPWRVYDGCSWRRIGIAHSQFDDCAVLAPTKASDGHPDLTCSRGNNLQANLDYIAAADPQTILALLDASEAKDRRIEALKAVAHPLADIAQIILAEAPPDADEFTIFTDSQGCHHKVTLAGLRSLFAALSGNEGQS